MDYQDNNFHFYNSENDGYRGSFGDYCDPAPHPPVQPPQTHRFGKKVIALALTCALLGGAAGVGGAALYNHLTGPGPAVIYQSDYGNTAQTMANSNPSGSAMTPAQLYAANVDSCVGITVSTTTTNIFGQTSTSAASGSGFVITQDGYIVTNHHVIEDAAKDNSVPITVTFHDGSSYQATLVGYEADNDVAVLKIDATGLKSVTLGDSSGLVVGETVMAIGNPLGELTYSLTDGLVSALDRLITTQDGGTLNMLQTNCAINPGNSGGPLFNSYGEVIGITTAKYTTSSSGTSVEGLGFAIPINDVKSIISDLIQYGYVTGKPYMGIQVTSVSTSDQQRYGISPGAYVESVTAGSSAEKAGLQAGDIITALDDTAIDSNSALTAALSAYRAGDTATMTVTRQNQELKLTITFDEKNDTTEAANQVPEQNERQNSQSGQDGQSGYYYQWPFGSLLP